MTDDELRQGAKVLTDSFDAVKPRTHAPRPPTSELVAGLRERQSESESRAAYLRKVKDPDSENAFLLREDVAKANDVEAVFYRSAADTLERMERERAALVELCHKPYNLSGKHYSGGLIEKGAILALLGITSSTTVRTVRTINPEGAT